MNSVVHEDSEQYLTLTLLNIIKLLPPLLLAHSTTPIEHYVVRDTMLLARV